MVIPIEGRTERQARRGATLTLLLAGFVLTGVVTTLLGPLLPILIARWSMSDTRAGLFFTWQFCGCLVGITSLGGLLSWRGYRLTFFLGFTLVSLGIAALISASESVGMFSTALFGCGLGLILPSANLWVAEVTPARRAAALSVLNLAWGCGAVACPALVMFAQKANRLGALLLGIAACAGFLALALPAFDLEPRGLSHPVARVSPPAMPRGPGNHHAEEPRRQTESTRTAVVLGGLFFLYVGTEASVSGWIAALAKRIPTTPGNLWTLAPLFFWAGLLAGRALAPLALLRLSEATLLTGELILAAMGTGGLWWATTFRDAALCVTASGLGLACIYPLLIARMVGYYGQRARRTGSVLFALASLGGATMPWLVGFLSVRAGSLRTGLLVPLAGCLAMMNLWSLLRSRWGGLSTSDRDRSPNFPTPSQ